MIVNRDLVLKILQRLGQSTWQNLNSAPIAEDKSVKLTVELPAAVHRELLAYAEVLGRETGQGITEPTKLDCADVGAVLLQRIAHSQKSVAQLKRDQVAVDSALPIASGNLLVPDCHCPISNVLKSLPGSARFRVAEFAIGQAREVRADVGFRYQTDSGCD